MSITHYDSVDKIDERYEQMVNDEDHRIQVLCKINDKFPQYFFECYVNKSNPEKGFIFEEAMLAEVIEDIKEWG
ncbi:MAG: hypothetical protein P1U85_21915 [Verrucomicrobiales bacterium]|nr:hypothetical protein [Verrucomicrobiales bacterium]